MITKYFETFKGNYHQLVQISSDCDFPSQIIEPRAKNPVISSLNLQVFLQLLRDFTDLICIIRGRAFAAGDVGVCVAALLPQGQLRVTGL